MKSVAISLLKNVSYLSLVLNKSSSTEIKEVIEPLFSLYIVCFFLWKLKK